MVSKCEDWPHSSGRYYFLGEKDLLVDPYTFDGEPVVIAGDKRKYFTEGYVIGSELFKIHVQEGLFQTVPVPF